MSLPPDDPPPVAGDADAAATAPEGAPVAAELRRRRQQLKTRVRGEPQRLDLREQLAALYRAEGNASQAGRWAYLSASADPDETAAFRRAHGDDPVEIMRALRWAGSEEDATTEVARERLRAVLAAARDRGGRRVTWDLPDREDSPWWVAGGCLAVLVVLALAVVGGITVVRWVTGGG